MKIKTISLIVSSVVAIVGYWFVMAAQLQVVPVTPSDGNSGAISDSPAVTAAPSRPSPGAESTRAADEISSPTGPSGRTSDTGSQSIDYTQPKRQLRQSQIVVGQQQFPNKTYQALLDTNDPLGSQPWERTVSLDQARTIADGDYTPTVAVIDSGFALDHEDLRDVWATNDAESGTAFTENPSRLNCSDQSLPLDQSCNNIDDDFNGTVDDESGATSVEHDSTLNCSDQARPLDKTCNMIDDDNNGLVDDYLGYDFVNFNSSVQAGETDPASSAASHGTLVSGIVGATTDNGLGIAGAASQVKILPLQALDDSGWGYTISVADAVVYAAQRDVDVISLSLGGNSVDSYLRQAIDYATYNGAIVIAASGNDGCECISYPAALSSVVAVGALDQSQLPADFSNWGQQLDIMAPGVSLDSTSWTAASPTQAYASASGTSLATPVVSGLAARLIGHQPNLSPIQVKAMLGETNNPLTLGSDEVRSNQLGFGLIDAQTSVSRATTPRILSQATTFDHIRYGQSYQQQWSQVEVNRQATVYDCPDAVRPTSAIYELTKGNDLLLTVSQVERDRAVDVGYSTKLAFYGCLLQPHDQAEVTRTINTTRELYNQQRKD